MRQELADLSVFNNEPFAAELRRRETAAIADRLRYAQQRLSEALRDWPEELTPAEVDRLLPALARADAVLHRELQLMLGSR